MSKRDSTVVVTSNFVWGREDIEDAFYDHKTIYLQAQGNAIETAISLAEYFVKKERKKLTTQALPSTINLLLAFLKTKKVFKCPNVPSYSPPLLLSTREVRKIRVKNSVFSKREAEM
jgi:hypothetical protein